MAGTSTCADAAREDDSAIVGLFSAFDHGTVRLALPPHKLFGVQLAQARDVSCATLVGRNVPVPIDGEPTVVVGEVDHYGLAVLTMVKRGRPERRQE